MEDGRVSHHTIVWDPRRRTLPAMHTLTPARIGSTPQNQGPYGSSVRPWCTGAALPATTQPPTYMHIYCLVYHIYARVVVLHTLFVRLGLALYML